jgi:A/G-specific adenine glycosylase
LKQIAQIIEEWYEINKRTLPWRNNPSAYQIWLSEIILQQTRVNQGLAYYNRFIDKFPTIQELAQASIKDILKLWQGLGYYSRARNLHITAKYITNNYNGNFPPDFKELLSLKGVGEYTAAAIASIAFNIPVAVVDGNVFRVLSRLCGIKSEISSATGKKIFRQKAEEILNKNKPGTHNQALMELGALICLPRNPLCDKCPLNALCYAYKNKMINLLPVKKSSGKTRERYFHYIHLSYHGNTFIHQRRQKDIWHLLFEFPLIETPQYIQPEKLPEVEEWKQLLSGTRYVIKSISQPFTHKLTHQTLKVLFYHVDINNSSKTLLENYLCIPENKINKYPVSKLTEKYLKTNLLQ